MNDKRTWRPQPKTYISGPFTVESPGYKKVDGETIPRRNARCKDELKTRPDENTSTVYDIFKRSAEKYGNAKAIGQRDLIRKHEEVKKVKKTIDGKEQQVDKKWIYYEMSEYHYMSFNDYAKMALQCGAGLRKLGLEAGDRVHIFAATSPYWLAMAHASSSQSMPIVTAYDTLGEEGLKHSMQQTHAKAIFLDAHLLPKLVNVLKSAKDIKHVIYNKKDGVKDADVENLKKAHPQITIHSFEELRKSGEENEVDPVPPKPEDLCCIMYTSGSTGTPKGVLLKHKNVIAAVAGVHLIIGDYLGPGDALLTYLPLAHILEFVFENAVLYWGGTMGYGNPKTLSDGSMRNCAGDIREFKPTILVGVPAVWESVRKGIMSKVAAGNLVVRNMFWGAMAAKSMMMYTGAPGAGVLDSVVFKKVKEATGGRLRICMNGGGPISKDTQRFVSLAITPMISGYGLTETAAMGALTDPAAWTDEALGEIPGSIEVKLVDFEDAGYFAKNDPPQGEVWIRGASVVEGYLDLEKETKESFTDDGWFKTGDIGEFDSKGQLKIIDRKKNLVKMQHGEYIALEKLESVYRSCHVVANICVYASQDKNKPIAIIVPAEPALKKLAQQHGIAGNGVEDLAHNKDVNDIVLKEMQQTGRSGGLSGIEIIEGIVLADEEWTPQNGLVTSAQKLNRKGLTDKYKKEIEEAYKSSA